MKKVLITSAMAALLLSGCSSENEALKPANESAPASSTPVTKAPESTTAPEVAKETVEPTATEKSVPREYKAALKKAESYAETMSMSKAAIYDQLTSEYGENFPKEAAQYAIDNITFDWNENALKKAKSYAEDMSMSDSAIYDQLISEYGEKFTKEEAKYAIDNLE
ncbi:Ltp family lipoprotein [Cohnella cholangitidis]|uniref:Putative host cell surface-exposed lipoprotein Ltp-like HTH region domain-containing protein n=1 Tax=Cohnella cholangitidis TaxID=2598458 RepID=A0A7G5C3H1_9BACL|nr:Ltp family lipoprotein [Cohnella cholangitidis]QMV43755.1 hypothetical protein FPL14_23210 [Cohnella cholangitidis]